MVLWIFFLFLSYKMVGSAIGLLWCWVVGSF